MAAVVLADLSVETEGVSLGADEIQAALDRIEGRMDGFERQGRRSSNTINGFTNRLFNLRSAMNVVARSFGIVGVVTALALAVRRLTTDVLDNTEAWGDLKESLNDAYLEAVKGEDSFTRLSRKMIDSAKAAGVETRFAAVEQASRITKLIRETEERLHDFAPGDVRRVALELDLETFNRQLDEVFQKLEDAGLSRGQVLQLGGNQQSFFAPLLAQLATGIFAATGQTGAFGLVPQNQTPRVQAAGPVERLPEELLGAAGLRSLQERSEQMELLGEAVAFINKEFAQTGNLERWNAGIEKLRASATGLHATSAELQGLGITAFDFFEVLGVPSITEYEKKMGIIDSTLEQLAGKLQAGVLFDEVPLNLYQQALENIQKQLVALGFSLDEATKKMAEMGLVMVESASTGIVTFKESMEALADQVTASGFLIEAFQEVTAGMAAVISSAFFEEEGSIKESVGRILKTLAEQCIAFAVYNTALGIYALTPVGSAIGKPQEYFAAAAAFFAAAAVIGVAARAVIGDSSAGESDTDQNNFRRQPPGQNVTVVIEGSLLGTDENSLARSLNDLLTKAQSDGAR